MDCFWTNYVSTQEDCDQPGEGIHVVVGNDTDTGWGSSYLEILSLSGITIDENTEITVGDLRVDDEWGHYYRTGFSVSFSEDFGLEGGIWGAEIYYRDDVDAVIRTFIHRVGVTEPCVFEVRTYDPDTDTASYAYVEGTIRFSEPPPPEAYSSYGSCIHNEEFQLVQLPFFAPEAHILASGVTVSGNGDQSNIAYAPAYGLGVFYAPVTEGGNCGSSEDPGIGTTLTFSHGPSIFLPGHLYYCCS